MYIFLITESNVPHKVEASIEINNVANVVYKHNFSETVVLNRNIENLSAELLNKLEVDTILMSPPCQPFTRNGLQADVADNRSSPFKRILEILPDLKVSKILIENVKGFETSVMRDMLIEALNQAGFSYQEFILSPSQLGIPNSRHRYYCIARKNDSFKFDVTSIVVRFNTFRDYFYCICVFSDECIAFKIQKLQFSTFFFVRNT